MSEFFSKTQIYRLEHKLHYKFPAVTPYSTLKIFVSNITRNWKRDSFTILPYCPGFLNVPLTLSKQSI